MGMTLYVSKLKKGIHGDVEYRSISEALQSIRNQTEEPITIVVREGVYREKLEIKHSHLTIIGLGRVVITWDDYAGKLMENGETYGTFRSYTVFVDANDFTARNIVFENSAGPVGQALALYADGDRMIFDQCAFLGYQDTIFTGPLPPKEGIPGGFRGPKEFAPRINGRHYFRRCYISGSVDFIFGSATAYFEECEIVSRKRGYITAASTPEGQKYGYVFSGCHLRSEVGEDGKPCCENGSVFLGRPWREYAKTVFLCCEMDRHIAVEGWSDWNKPEVHQTIFSAEYCSGGEGAAIGGKGRAVFSSQMTRQEAEEYTKHKVLGGTDGWNPE